jgi:hypothetical protein
MARPIEKTQRARYHDWIVILTRPTKTDSARRLENLTRGKGIFFRRREYGGELYRWALVSWHPEGSVKVGRPDGRALVRGRETLAQRAGRSQHSNMKTRGSPSSAVLGCGSHAPTECGAYAGRGSHCAGRGSHDPDRVPDRKVSVRSSWLVAWITRWPRRASSDTHSAPAWRALGAGLLTPRGQRESGET